MVNDMDFNIRVTEADAPYRDIDINRWTQTVYRNASSGLVHVSMSIQNRKQMRFNVTLSVGEHNTKQWPAQTLKRRFRGNRLTETQRYSPNRSPEILV